MTETKKNESETIMIPQHEDFFKKLARLCDEYGAEYLAGRTDGTVSTRFKDHSLLEYRFETYTGEPNTTNFSIKEIRSRQLVVPSLNTKKKK